MSGSVDGNDTDREIKGTNQDEDEGTRGVSQKKNEGWREHARKDERTDRDRDRSASDRSALRLRLDWTDGKDAKRNVADVVVRICDRKLVNGRR